MGVLRTWLGRSEEGLALDFVQRGSPEKYRRGSKRHSPINLKFLFHVMTTRSGKDKSTAEFDGPRALYPTEYASALKLINAVLRPNVHGTILNEYPLVLGTDNIENLRVIVRGGEVVSHAAIYFSNLRAGDLVFKVGGIGSVATHPDHRGRGLASAVIRDCVRIMEQAKCHLSVLWTQRRDFYRRLGYEAAGSEYLFRARASDFSHISRECKIVPYSPEHLSAVVDIHERETCRTERPRKEYEAYFGLPKTRTLLAVRGNTVTAYAVMGKGEDFRSCVHEWGGDASDVLCLVRAFARSSSTGEIVILTPAYESEFTHFLKQMQLLNVFEYLAMMRVIDVEGLLSLLQEWRRDLSHFPRTIHIHPANQVGLGDSLPAPVFRIVRTQAGIDIKVGEEEARLDQEQKLARLLFGPDSPSSLLRGLSPETIHALESVLPIPLFIWGLDSV